MAANDITISVAGASTSIKVHQTRRPDKNQLPEAVLTQTVVAGGSAVINMGNSDTLMIERTDHIEPVAATLEVRARNQHK